MDGILSDDELQVVVGYSLTVFVCGAAYTNINKLLHANSVCVENTVHVQRGRHSTSDGISVCCHSQIDICLKCMVGLATDRQRLDALFDETA